MTTQVIEKDELLDPTKPSSEVKLPEEIQAADDPDKHTFEGPKTWEVKKLYRMRSHNQFKVAALVQELDLF